MIPPTVIRGLVIGRSGLSMRAVLTVAETNLPRRSYTAPTMATEIHREPAD